MSAYSGLLGDRGVLILERVRPEAAVDRALVGLSTSPPRPNRYRPPFAFSHFQQRLGDFRSVAVGNSVLHSQQPFNLASRRGNQLVEYPRFDVRLTVVDGEIR